MLKNNGIPYTHTKPTTFNEMLKNCGDISNTLSGLEATQINVVENSINRKTNELNKISHANLKAAKKTKTVLKQTIKDMTKTLKSLREINDYLVSHIETPLITLEDAD